MSRYIDADALLESVKSKRLIFEESTPAEEAIAEQVSVFEEAIEEAPTANVVEVVRCKECKFRNTSDCAMWHECDNCGVQYSWETNNDYCSYGERSENGK